MRRLEPVAVTVRQIDDRLWSIFSKTGPLTDEERELLAAAEAEYEEEHCNDL